MYQHVSDFTFKQLKSVILGIALEKPPICLQHLLFNMSFEEAEGNTLSHEPDAFFFSKAEPDKIQKDIPRFLN